MMYVVEATKAPEPKSKECHARCKKNGNRHLLSVPSRELPAASIIKCTLLFILSKMRNVNKSGFYQQRWFEFLTNATPHQNMPNTMQEKNVCSFARSSGEENACLRRRLQCDFESRPKSFPLTTRTVTWKSAHIRSVRQDARGRRVSWSKESLDELQMGQNSRLSKQPQQRPS